MTAMAEHNFEHVSQEDLGSMVGTCSYHPPHHPITPRPIFPAQFFPRNFAPISLLILIFDDEIMSQPHGDRMTPFFPFFPSFFPLFFSLFFRLRLGGLKSFRFCITWVG